MLPFPSCATGELHSEMVSMVDAYVYWHIRILKPSVICTASMVIFFV